jgi:hypothetical protein
MALSAYGVSHNRRDRCDLRCGFFGWMPTATGGNNQPDRGQYQEYSIPFWQRLHWELILQA